MTEKTLKFDNISVNKKEFHKSKQPIDLDVVNVDQIVVSDKFKNSDDGLRHVIGYKEGKTVKPLCIILTLITGYITYLENGGKSRSFAIKDHDVLDKYNEIWDNIKETLSIRFHSTPVYDKKYIITKVREFSSVIKTNLLSDKVPKENEHYTSIACIIIGSVMKMQRKITCWFI